MELIAVKTRVLTPPKDNLIAALDEAIKELREKDIVIISSKVAAIDEGRCLPVSSANKEALVKEEAEVLIDRPYWNSPLTIQHHTFLGAAGIDESNADGHYVLLPKEPFESAKKYYEHLKRRFSLKELGVIITDSRSLPFRFGATGVAIGFWGVQPLISHIGEKDLFGREIQVEKSNLIDGLAASATVVMGEVAECTPVVIIRNAPRVTFREGDLRRELFVDFKNDTFRVLYERFLNR